MEDVSRLATRDQAEMAYKDLAKIHSTYYHELRRNNVPRNTAARALLTAVYLHISHMFQCKEH